MGVRPFRPRRTRSRPDRVRALPRPGRAAALVLLLLVVGLLGVVLLHRGVVPGQRPPAPATTVARGAERPSGGTGERAAGPARGGPTAPTRERDKPTAPTRERGGPTAPTLERDEPTGSAREGGGPDDGAANPDIGGAGVEPPVRGPGTFGYATGRGPILGTAGTLHRFHVATEDDTGQEPAGFADAVEEILGDSRSWIASEQVRFQRVPPAVAAEFTVYLATPATSERMCAEGGLETEGFTSCRLPGQVVINLARWFGAIPEYGAPLGVYQAYAVNHEVGHELGEGHEECPGEGRPAPVMQQQTYGLEGCLANPWPYPDGRRYSGPPVS
ncbi:DUF3152 domain-containing protein [Micromonospora sp. NPDC049559]|uniref:DUF3152 domain-containing protein n=1 Tax=Micromonospora sp. NPDC049559 TaxID=3155923 RepID=UPI00341E30A2